MPDSNVHSTPPSSSGSCSMKHVVISENELTELPRSTYECDLCGLRVKTKANLRAHNIKTHRILKSDSDLAFYTKQKNTINYVYHCPMVPCKHNIGGDGGFASCSRLKQHFQNVHMSKTFACQRCEQRFPTPSAQAYHMRLCGKIYVCTVCSKTYSVKKHLMQHFRRSGHHPVNKDHPRERIKSKEGVFPVASEFRRTSTVNALPIQNEINLCQPQQSVWLPFLMLPISFPTWNGLDFTCMGVYNMPSYGSLVTSLFAGGPAPEPFSCDAKATKSDPIAFELVSQECGTSSFVDRSTQTEYVDVAVDATNFGPNASSVSVNIGTDEDDISTFIGSLFCDASVATELLGAELVHEFTDTELDTQRSSQALDQTSTQQYARVAYDTCDLQPGQPTLDYAESESSALPADVDSQLNCQIGFQPFSLRSTTSFENAEMQTEHIGKINVAAATHEPPMDRQTYFCSDRPLETPPPLRSQSATQLMSICRPRIVDSPRSKQSTPDVLFPTTVTSSLPDPPMPTTVSTTFTHVERGPYSISTSHSSSELSKWCSVELNTDSRTSDPLTKQQREHTMPSFQSVGLQSSCWSPAPPVCASMETQTVDANFESWLNSVHTQTSQSAFDLHAFADMGVGVDEDFLTAALESVEAEDKFSNA